MVLAMLNFEVSMSKCYNFLPFLNTNITFSFLISHFRRVVIVVFFLLAEFMCRRF
jgi:hypothetical protein